MSEGTNPANQPVPRSSTGSIPQGSQMPPHPLDAEWFMMAGGQKYGPFTGHKLREFALDGRLEPGTEIVRAGGSEWVRAGEDPALRGVFAGLPVPASGSHQTYEGGGQISAGRGATVVQVTNHIPNQPRVIIEDGEAKPKSAGTALLLSFLFPGLGQFYNGHIGKGFLFIVFCLLFWLVLLGWIFNIWSMIDAYSSAKRMNDRYQRRLAAGLVV